MFKSRRFIKGQSLIETTFFLIILLMLVAAIVELGGVMQVKLTVVNSAREGARFGTSGATNADITLITQQATSKMLAYREDNADIFVIRAKTNKNGTIVPGNCPPPAKPTATDSYWCVEQTVGAPAGGGMDPLTFVTPAMVAQRLGADTQVVGVAVQYEHHSLLGLPFISYLIGTIPVNSYTIMRVEATSQTPACIVWPIALHESVVGWPNGPANPNLEDILVSDPGGHSVSGNFGWLRWNNNPGEGSAQELAGRLRDPQTSLDEFTNAADTSDHSLNVGDWVWGNTGWVHSKDVEDAVKALEGQYIRVLVFDMLGGSTPPGGACTGSNCSFHVVGYAVVQLTSDMQSPTKSISARFVRFDTGCK